jgi:hypothetical protein
LKTARRYCLNSEFILASVLNLPFTDEIFDIAFMWKVSEKNAIQEIPGANFLLSASNSHIIYNFADHDYFLFRIQRDVDLESHRVHDWNWLFRKSDKLKEEAGRLQSFFEKKSLSMSKSIEFLDYTNLFFTYSIIFF